MYDEITIDGSFGEGGGQILRTSLAMSLVTGKPFRINNIRAGRKKPGLMHQHLTSVNAAAEVGQAVVRGNEIGSQKLYFMPKTIQAGRYHFSVGTAGSCTLVLQTVLPALLTADSESQLVLEGGTHNPYAPPFDFLAGTFLPIIKHMEPKVTARLERPGFYPAGGGKMTVSIQPARELAPLVLLERGRIKRLQARAMVARLPLKIGQQEMIVIGERLSIDKNFLKVEEVRNSRGPGNVVFVEIEGEHVTEIFAGFGEKRLPAEEVAERIVKSVREYLDSDVPVGRNLADQLLIPMALAGAGKFRTVPLTQHTMTNIEVIKQFLDIKITASQIKENVWEIEM